MDPAPPVKIVVLGFAQAEAFGDPIPSPMFSPIAKVIARRRGSFHHDVARSHD
jgi:hypothetical protein